MALQSSLPTPQCAGINHADFSIDGRFAIFTCEFGGMLVKIDMVGAQGARLPEAVDRQACRRTSASRPTAATFYVADMMADGVFVIDGASFKEIGFIKTGKGTHGLYPSRDGKKLYVANRGSNKIHGAAHGHGQRLGARLRDRARSTSPGRSRAAAAPTWATSAPTASGSGSRAATTTSSTRSTPPPARCKIIPVGQEPHGLTVWPQPGRYSLGHTGNMR